MDGISAISLPLGPDKPGALRWRAVHRATGEIKRGSPVLLTGDAPLLVAPAETVNAEALAWMASRGGGLVLLAAHRAAAVLDRMPNAESAIVALCLAAPAEVGAVRALADPTLAQLVGEPRRITTPPTLAHAALAIAKLARLLPAMVAVDAGPDAMAEATARDVLTVPASDVLAYPSALVSDLHRVAEAAVPLEAAEDARVVAFRAPDMGVEHLAILVGAPERQPAPLVRVHSECFTGDLLGSLRCDCGQQLRGALGLMREAGGGALLYLAQEGRGIGLVNKLRAYALQDRGMDTLDANEALGWGADERNFLIAARMLRELGLQQVRLLTNNPDKVAALAACGIEVIERVSLAYPPNGTNDRYLRTKARRFGHLMR